MKSLYSCIRACRSISRDYNTLHRCVPYISSLRLSSRASRMNPASSLVATICRPRYKLADRRGLRAVVLTTLFVAAFVADVTEGGIMTRVEASRYLAQFGYLNSAPENIRQHQRGPPEGADGQLIEALLTFQTFMGLPRTGRLDNATLELMARPRCGMKDVESSGVRRKRASSVRLKWPRNHLTFRLDMASAKVPREKTLQIIEMGLALWSRYTPLTFTEVTTNNRAVDIGIKFARGAHMDRYPFDGPSNVLAHAFFPPTGDAHFDEDEPWSTDTPGMSRAPEISLLVVFVHEIGHSLGLEHSTDRKAIMAPYYDPRFYRTLVVGALPEDDIMRIQALYGERVEIPTTTTTREPTTTTTREPTTTTTREPTTTTTREPTTTTTREPTTTTTREPTTTTTREPTTTTTREPTTTTTREPTTTTTREPTTTTREPPRTSREPPGTTREPPTTRPTAEPSTGSTSVDTTTSNPLGNCQFRFRSLIFFRGFLYASIYEDRVFLYRLSETGAIRARPYFPYQSWPPPFFATVYWPFDAAFTITENGEEVIYIFSNQFVWKFNSRLMPLLTRFAPRFYADLIQNVFPGIPTSNIDAAFQHLDNGIVYIFKGGKYYGLQQMPSDQTRYRVIPGYPRSLSRWNLPETFTRIDTVVTLPARTPLEDNRIYFFSGLEYIKYEKPSVVAQRSNEGPLSIRVGWIGCSGPNELRLGEDPLDQLELRKSATKTILAVDKDTSVDLLGWGFNTSSTRPRGDPGKTLFLLCLLELTMRWLLGRISI